MPNFSMTPQMRKMVEDWEGNILTAYPDPGTGGEPWTIGYGHTGPDVNPGLTITQEQADALLASDLQKFERDVNGVCGDATNQNQFDALVSFAYNCGFGNLQASTLLRLHQAGDYPGAAGQFIRWNRAAGQVMAGLTRRREGEAAVYLNAQYA